MATRTSRAGKRPRIGPGRLSAEDAARLPDRLLDAAMRLFAANGFGATTMEAIAREAGASTKTVYSRYANKTEILGAVTKRVADGMLASHAEIAPDPGGAEPRGFLLAFGRQLAIMFESKELVGMTRVAISEAYRMPVLAEFFVEGFTRNVTALRDVLEEWHAAGRLPDLVEPQEAARILIEMIVGIPRIRALIGKPLKRAEAEAHVRTAVDLFLRACGYRA